MYRPYEHPSVAFARKANRPSRRKRVRDRYISRGHDCALNQALAWRVSSSARIRVVPRACFLSRPFRGGFFCARQIFNLLVVQHSLIAGPYVRIKRQPKWPYRSRYMTPPSETGRSKQGFHYPLTTNWQFPIGSIASGFTTSKVDLQAQIQKMTNFSSEHAATLT